MTSVRHMSIAVLVQLCGSVYGMESHLGIGYDSNPHKLAEDDLFVGGVYTEIFVSGEQQVFEYPFFVLLDIQRKDFRPVQLEAASSRGGAGLGYRYELNEQWYVRTDYNYRLYDGLYVDRDTAELGENIDRFDAKWHQLDIEVAGSIVDNLQSISRLVWQDKDYKEVDNPATPSIDNKNWYLMTGLDYSWNGFKTGLSVSYGGKSYGERPALDSFGLPLVGETLSYSRLLTDIWVSYRSASNKFFIAVGTTFGEMNDDQSGYFDMLEERYFIELHYTSDDGDRVETRYEPINTSYKDSANRAYIETDESDLQDFDGYQWSASYNILLKKGKDYQFEFFARWQLETTNSIFSESSYDRQTFIIGVGSDF